MIKKHLSSGQDDFFIVGYGYRTLNKHENKYRWRSLWNSVLVENIGYCILDEGSWIV